MPRGYMKECPCGSGKEAQTETDARGIYIGYMCDDCRAEKLAKFRPEVLMDSNYECDEPIEADE